MSKPSASQQPDGRKKSSLLSFLLRSSPGAFLLALLASVASGFGGTALVALINESLSSDPDGLKALGARFAALCAGVLLLRLVSDAQLILLSQATLARLRSHLSERVAVAHYRKLESQGAGTVLSTLTEDVSTIAYFFTSLPDLLMHGAVVVGCLAYLGMLSWQVFSFSIVVVVLGSAGYQLAQARALGHLRRARLGEEKLVSLFKALLDGAKELRLHDRRRQEFLDRVLEPTIQDIRRDRSRGLLISAASAGWGNALFFVLIGSVLFLLARFVQVDGRVMSGYALIFIYMILPLEAVLGALPNVHRARVALERVERVTGELPSSEQAEAPSNPPFASLALAGVRHVYRREDADGLFELGPVDLKLEAGELVFLIGGNGSGKTTLAKVLVGLYEPVGGEIRLNGAVVRDAAAYRQHFSTVFSDFFLFDELLGVERAGLDARAARLLETLRLTRQVTVSNGTLSTTELSQGQRKRLALLVAYLEDRPVYVFDEWAADQDPSYKEVFYRQLLPELKARGKAVLVVTHDDRYYDVADRCIKLEAGRLVPFGAGQARSMDGEVRLAPTVTAGGYA